ncbi:MAG: RNB domain-containing ribonuclease [Bacilli bacterium]
MKFKEKDISNIINSNNVDELKKALKIKHEEDYFKAFITYLEKIIYYYDDRYAEVVNRLLDFIEQDVLLEEDYLKKCDKIIVFRNRISNINKNLFKKSKNDKYNYYDLKNIKISLEKLDNCFNEEIKKSKIDNDDFDEILDFSCNLLRKFSINNFDILNRLFNYLEKELSNDTKGVLKKCDSINYVKKLIQSEICKRQNNYQQEKNNINNYNYLLGKLDKIEINLRNNIEDDLNYKEIDNVFDYLLNNLTSIIINFSERNVDAVYKILDLLEKEIIKNNDINYLKEAEKILELRKSIVDTIKSTKKNTRNSHRKYFYLKEIANKLENLEINIAYNIKSEEVMTNYNVIRYIIFDLENIKYTENLIKNNPYLINAFNLNSENIMSLVVDKYLETINSGDKLYEKICYYDRTLSLLLNSKFIRIDDEIKDENISKITKMYKNKLVSGKSNEFITSWYKNLINKINDVNYVADEKELNRMYNIIVPKDERLENTKFIENGKSDDFIITIDEEINVNKDDAFSVKKLDNGLYNLKVYIADPSSFFSNDSLSMRIARNNAETIYLEDKKIDMFHPDTINNYLSLDERKLRNVKIYDFILDKKGNLINFDIQKGSRIVSKNYSYDEFNDLFDICDTKDEEKLIEDLIVIRNILSNKGLEEVAEKELGIEITTAEKLVATFMIYTNNKVAEYFAKNDYPFVYRHYTYDKPFIDRSILEVVPFEEKEKYDHFLEEIGKTSNNAVYSLESKNHDALGLGYYTHITSPNRRYADIIANNCIDNFCFNNLTDKQIKDFEKYLKNEVDYLNDRLEGIKNYYDGYARYVLTRK